MYYNKNYVKVSSSSLHLPPSLFSISISIFYISQYIFLYCAHLSSCLHITEATESKLYSGHTLAQSLPMHSDPNFLLWPRRVCFVRLLPGTHLVPFCSLCPSSLCTLSSKLFLAHARRAVPQSLCILSFSSGLTSFGYANGSSASCLCTIVTFALRLLTMLLNCNCTAISSKLPFPSFLFYTVCSLLVNLLTCFA